MQCKLTLVIIASLVAVPAVAGDRRLPERGTPARGVYMGAFGGWGVSTSTDISQLGTAFLPRPREARWPSTRRDGPTAVVSG